MGGGVGGEGCSEKSLKKVDKRDEERE